MNKLVKAVAVTLTVGLLSSNAMAIGYTATEVDKGIYQPDSGMQPFDGFVKVAPNKWANFGDKSITNLGFIGFCPGETTALNGMGCRIEWRRYKKPVSAQEFLVEKSGLNDIEYVGKAVTGQGQIILFYRLPERAKYLGDNLEY